MSERADDAAFRERLRDLLDDARARGVPAGLLLDVAELAADVCDELERRRRRPSTEEQLAIVRKLEPLLRECDNAEARIGLVCRKVGVRRSRAYRLLGLLASSTEKWIST